MKTIAPAGEKKTVVRIAGVHKSYKGGGEALRGIDLDVPKGELFGLIGPDGAGKTTALKILAGVTKPTSGTVEILGRSPKKAKQFLGYVHQDACLYPELSCEENLRYQAGLLNVPEDSLRAFMQTQFDEMGLLPFSDRLLSQLSGGMKQKLALCCALVSNPQLILLDEPTTGLDPMARRDLWHALENLTESGVTVLLATPFIDEAERCTEIALIHEGKIREYGAPRDLQNALQMRRLIFFMPEPKPLENLPSLLEEGQLKQIKDAYWHGECIEVLGYDPAAIQKEMVEYARKTGFEIKDVQEMDPTLENVFIMKLRDLGYKTPANVEFPRIREDRQKSAKDQFMHGNNVAIAAAGLEKLFGTDFYAVKGVDLTVRFGEILGLLGANGAGKTTTIKMLCGLMEPTAGNIEVMGRTGDLRGADLRRAIGYMSQKFSLYDSLTVEENLKFYAAIYDIAPRLRQRQIDWVVQACDLKGILKSIVSKLPLGWKQRIAFGAAVMHEPKIIFLDEPTAGVDPLARRQIWCLIREFAHNGAAVLVTTHYLAEMEFANRVAFLANKRIVRAGTVRELKQGGTTMGRTKDSAGSGQSLEQAFIDAVRQSEQGRDS